MADRIKGITVEIGGDTVGLDNALKNTNKEIKSTQSELKEVEKLLKLDPSNVTLLTQKQGLLTNEISKTTEKLNTLKMAKEQADKVGNVDKNSEQYRELERQIVSTEQSLKNLNGQVDDNNKKLDKANKGINNVTQNTEKLNKVMQGAGLAVIGLGAGLLKSAVDAGKSADDINTLAKQTGLSTEQIQKFQYASDRIDVSLDTLAGSMAKLTKNMATASKGTGDAYNAFQKLGVEITNTDGSLRNNQDVFNETINKLGEMENETERDALAMQIFGKSAQDLNPLILGGAEALEELGREAEEAGLILSQDALDSANEFNDSIDKLKATASGAFTEIGSEIATALIPVMEKVEELVSWLLDNKDTIVVALASISAGILAFNAVTMIQNMVKAFQAWKVATEGMTIAQKALNLVMNANPLGLIVTAIAAVVAAIITLWNTNEGFRDALIGAWNAIRNTLTSVWGAVANFFTETIPNAFQTVIDFVKEHWQDLLFFITNPIAGAINLLYELNPKFKEWVDNLLKKIKDWFIGIKDVGKYIVEGLWQGILNAKGWLLNKIKGFASTITDGIKSFFGIESPSKVMRDQVGKFIAQGIGVGFGREMPKVISDMEKQLSDVTISLSNLSIGEIPSVPNKITSQNFYTTKYLNSATEVIRQPSTVVLEIDKRELGRVVVPAYNNTANRIGVVMT